MSPSGKKMIATALPARKSYKPGLSKSKGKKKLPRKVLGILFADQKLLRAALTHPSYRNENACASLDDFDRLEFLGDAILNFIICTKLYSLYPQANEGLLSRLRSILVSRKILARVATKIRLGSHLYLGKSLKRQFRYSKNKIFADAFEAFIAAIYFDQGFKTTDCFIQKHFQDLFDAKKLFRLDPNPKSTLQEFSQKQWQHIPVYRSEVTPNGIKTEVAVLTRQKAVAVGRTRQESEEKAARFLLKKIRQEEWVRRSKRKSSGKKLRKIF